MSPIFVFINACLFVSAVLFFIKRFRTRRFKRNQAISKPRRRAIGETPFRKNAGRSNLVLHCPPAHFDGHGHRVERALDRESILFSITRNPALAVEKEDAT